MAEKDLLKLLREKHPGEFTREQTDEMRALLGESKRLQNALARKLQFDQELAELVCGIDVPVDEIVEATEGRKAQVEKISTAVGIVVMVGLLGLLFFSGREEKTKVKEPASENVSTAPVKKKEPPKPREPESVAEKPVVPPGTEPAGTIAETKPVEVKKVELPPEERVAELIAPDRELSFEYTCFRELVDPLATPSRDTLRTWLEPAVWIKKDFRISERRINNRPLGALSGIYRLRPEWPAGGVLRLSLFEHQPPVLIHLWRGKEGVLLSFSPGGHMAAYRQLREGKEHSGKAGRLYGCQQVRLEPSPLDLVRGLDQVAFEIRHQEGYLLVMRGDHELMRAPVSGPPEEVYVEGRVSVSGICMYRGGPVPESVVVKTRGRAGRPGWALDAAALTKLDWKGELPEKTALGKDVGRGLTLSGEVENTSVDSFALIPSGKELFNEIILRLEDVTPGTAVFLGDEKGAPLFGIGFVLNKQTNGVISFVPPDDFNAIPREQNIPIRGQIVPMWGSGQWLKLAVGRDVLRLFVSNDGGHWNEVKTMQRKGTGYSRVPFSTVGLRLVGNGKQEQDRKITLRHLEIRPARSFSQFMPAPLAAKLTDFFVRGGEADSLVDWVSVAVSSCPEDVELDAWLRACAAYCLRHPGWKAYASGNGKNALRPQLFMGLVDSALSDEKISLVSVLELIHEIALFSGHWDLTHRSSFAAWGFGKLGEAAGRRGEKKAYTFMKPWLFSTPSIFGKGLYPLPPVLVTRELLYYASAAEWEDGAEFCRQIRYWNRRGYPQANASAWIAGQEEVKEYVGWSEVDFSRRLGRKDEFQGVPLARHPLVTEYSKEGYNTLAEFQASIKNGAYNDACTILTSSDTSFIQGLLPDQQDQDLMVAWRLALVIALEEQPELRRTLQKKYANLGELRLKRSISRGDSEAVDAVTRQFYGTPSSVEAYIWLGDQALGIGESLLAEGYYRRARKNAQLANLSAIEARQRLAAAFSGRDIGKPPSGAVRFGDLTLEPDAFEKMVSELRQRYHSEEAGYDDSLPVDSSVKVSPPGIYTAERVGQFDFDKRFKAHRPNIPALATDWVGRQMALTVFEDYLLVNDRNDLRAYELASGKLRWSHLAGGQRGGSRDWPLLPMRPIVSGDLVVTRMISRQGPRLECLGLSDGVPKWVFATRDHAVSNPLLVEGDVVLLNLRRHEELGHELLFTRLARSTGEVLDERSLVNFRDDSKSRMFRQIQLGRSVDRLVASGYGSVICTDLRGRLLWVRKQPWRAFVRSAKWYLNHPVRPLFADGHVLISQPADESVASLRTDTGRLRWKAPVRELRQILGIADGKVIVSATGRLVALSLEDGRVVWQQQHGASRGFMVSGGDGAILSVAPVVRDNAMKSAGWGTLGLLSWVDVKDGRKLASWVVDFKLGAAAKGLHAGPMISTRDGVLLLAGEHDGDSRSIFRLVSKSRKFEPVSTSEVLDQWLPGRTSLKSGVASTLFPGWTLLESSQVGLGSFVREIPGVGPVFFTESIERRGYGGTQLGRLVKIPASGGQRLRLQLGSEGATGWTVEVQANGESLAKRLIPELPPPTGAVEEYTWLEDSVPSGAKEEGGWVWARKPDPVHSGERSLMVSGKGLLKKFFRGAGYRPVSDGGDKLSMWVWIDPKDPPRAIQLQLGRVGAPDSPSVAWGDLAGFGEPPPSPSPKRLGNLPPPGRWSRLDINLKELGIAKDTAISELAFVQVDGTAYYDKVSIVSKAVPQGLPPQLLGPRRWTNIEVDLSRFAGKTVWLRAGRVAEAEKKGHELWSKLELGD